MSMKMDAFVTLEVQGIKAALAGIAKYDQKVQQAVEAAIEKGVKNISEAAQKRVPVRSGKLKKSGRAKFDKASLTGTASFGARYAHIVEFGSVKSPARPFLFPSFQEEAPNIEKEIREAMEKT